MLSYTILDIYKEIKVLAIFFAPSTYTITSIIIIHKSQSLNTFRYTNNSYYHFHKSSYILASLFN